MYDLRNSIRSVLNHTDLTSTADITALVLDEIPPESLREVLALTLRPYVAEVVNAERRSAVNSTPAAGPRPAAPSWRRDGIRDLFHTRIYVGDHHKMLGDCTSDDITAAAIEREGLARANAASAARYRTLAATLDNSGAATVSDLPRAAVAAILRGDPS